jgi:adenine phosphoribosyltransferase
MARTVQKRQDPADGWEYTQAEFIDYYGSKKGQALWNQSGAVPKAKAKAKAKAKVKAKASRKPIEFPEVTPGSKHYALDPNSKDGKMIAEAIWWMSPKFSPKNVPAFYDLSSITEKPAVFKRVIDIFVSRYRAMGKERGPTHVVGYDARGFILGPPIAMALRIPFVLLRKDAKGVGVLAESSGYEKEYAEAKLDKLCMRLGAIKAPARVLLIDDLIATGGTALAGFELCMSCGLDVLEFAAIIDLPVCEGVQKIRAYAGGRFKDTPVFTMVDGKSVPEENCADPKPWAEDSRIVPGPKASELLAKYPDLK